MHKKTETSETFMLCGVHNLAEMPHTICIKDLNRLLFPYCSTNLKRKTNLFYVCFKKMYSSAMEFKECRKDVYMRKNKLQ